MIRDAGERMKPDEEGVACDEEGMVCIEDGVRRNKEGVVCAGKDMRRDVATIIIQFIEKVKLIIRANGCLHTAELPS